MVDDARGLGSLVDLLRLELAVADEPGRPVLEQALAEAERAEVDTNDALWNAIAALRTAVRDGREDGDYQETDFVVRVLRVLEQVYPWVASLPPPPSQEQYG